MNQQLDPEKLRKRALLFYFASGVNLLMAFWVLSVGGGRADSGTLTLVMLIFLAFAGLNWYMARKITKYLRRRGAARPGERVAAPPANDSDK